MTEDKQPDKTTTEGGETPEEETAPPTAAAPALDMMELATTLASVLAPIIQGGAPQAAQTSDKPAIARQGARRLR